MKKQLVIIGIVTILVSIGLSGCNEVSNTLNPEKNKFVGTWKMSELTINLFSDGTCSFMSWSGTWDLKDGKLVLDLPSANNPTTATYNYQFSNNDTTLTLTSPGETQGWVLTKQ